MNGHAARRARERRVRARLVLVHRLDPEAARSRLPAGWKPRLERGAAIGLVTYTNLGRVHGRFLPQRLACTHHLVHAIVAESERGDERALQVHRRATSARRGARWNERILRLRSGGTSFLFEGDDEGVELRARSADGDELYLRARTGGRAGSLLRTPAELEELLATSGDVRPLDPAASRAERLVAGLALAPEPLSVFELRGSFFAPELEEEPPAPLDSAWSLTPVRRQPLRGPSLEAAAQRRLLAAEDQPLPALSIGRSSPAAGA